mmetsp:Transcript_4710/g.13535  ORF Transcript_4710/g.13535 Transcript_4710/m.13535 type:complete len:450 (-) Transcript_4710:281-1630(-)
MVKHALVRRNHVVTPRMIPKVNLLVRIRRVRQLAKLVLVNVSQRNGIPRRVDADGHDRVQINRHRQNRVPLVVDVLADEVDTARRARIERWLLPELGPELVPQRAKSGALLIVVPEVDRRPSVDGAKVKVAKHIVRHRLGFAFAFPRAPFLYRVSADVLGPGHAAGDRRFNTEKSEFQNLDIYPHICEWLYSTRHVRLASLCGLGAALLRVRAAASNHRRRHHDAGPLPVLLEHGVDLLKRLVYLLPLLGTRQHHLATHKDEQHNLRLGHPVNQTGKQLGLVGAEHAVARRQPLQPNGKLDIAASHHVLNLELLETHWISQLLQDTGKLARRQPGHVLRFRSRAHHFAGRENQGRGLWLTDTHDHRSETLRIVLCIARVERNLLQVQTLAAEVDRRHDILQLWDDARGPHGIIRLVRDVVIPQLGGDDVLFLGRKQLLRVGIRRSYGPV